LLTAIVPSVESRHPVLAFLFAVPIAVLGGLIGLGGAEFRLPVLVGPLRYAARAAVPLNLAVSLVTIVASLLGRTTTLGNLPLATLGAPIAGLIAGAVITAFIGPALASRLSDERLERIILVLLVGIGIALIAEAFLPQAIGPLVPDVAGVQFVTACVIGLGIGLVSSLLGVAGGELIIPTFVFVFGVDIKLAGTASLLVSLPVVLVGVGRYLTRGAYGDRQALTQTVGPMAVGSVIGAVIGAALVVYAPTDLLKLGLGVILIASAIRVFRHARSPAGGGQRSRTARGAEHG
jgi:uncharacterized membrane protein YfcA